MNLYDQHINHHKNHRKDRFYQQCSGYGGDGVTENTPTQYKWDFNLAVQYDGQDDTEVWTVTAVHRDEAVNILAKQMQIPCCIVKVWNGETEKEKDAVTINRRVEGNE